MDKMYPKLDNVFIYSNLNLVGRKYFLIIISSLINIIEIEGNYIGILNIDVVCVNLKFHYCANRESNILIFSAYFFNIIDNSLCFLYLLQLQSWNSETSELYKYYRAMYVPKTITFTRSFCFYIFISLNHKLNDTFDIFGIVLRYTVRISTEKT